MRSSSDENDDNNRKTEEYRRVLRSTNERRLSPYIGDQRGEGDDPGHNSGHAINQSFNSLF